MSELNVAIIGASDSRIPWTSMLLDSLSQYQFAGDLWFVNPNRESVLGRKCYPSVSSLPIRPDLGVVLVNPRLAVPATEELAAAGASDIVIVANGFKESGTDEGIALEEALAKIATSTGVRIFGPNCVGFADFRQELCLIAQPMPEGIGVGPVSLVSQSGGLTGAAIGAIGGMSLGMDVCYTIGNGAAFGLVAALNDAVNRETTSVVCAVVESIDDGAELMRVAERARKAGTTLVFLLLGQSMGSRAVAQSHTGAIVGEYQVTAAWLRHLGVCVVESPAEMAHAAALTTYLGPPNAIGGSFVIAVSGGAVGLSGDIASREDVPLAEVGEETLERLRDFLPTGAHIGNPLDVATGNAPGAYASVASDESVDILIEPWVLPWPASETDMLWQQAAFDRVRMAAAESGKHVIIGSLYPQPLSGWARGYAQEHNVFVSPDLSQSLIALGRLTASQVPESTAADPPRVTTTSIGSSSGQMIGEAAGREILESAGLPIVLGRHCLGIEEVLEASREMTGPFALKIALPSLAHRERVGGVKLGITGEDSLRDACAEIASNARNAGVLDESRCPYLIQEMVNGPELLIGAVADPHLGIRSITVGIGGWAAEAGHTFGTLLLPASKQDIEVLIESSGLPHLLGAERAHQLSLFLSEVEAAVRRAPLYVYRTVELNPVIMTRNGPRIADVLLIG